MRRGKNRSELLEANPEIKLLNRAEISDADESVRLFRKACRDAAKGDYLSKLYVLCEALKPAEGAFCPVGLYLRLGRKRKKQ
jgi:hypothetical protein